MKKIFLTFLLIINFSACSLPFLTEDREEGIENWEISNSESGIAEDEIEYVTPVNKYSYMKSLTKEECKFFKENRPGSNSSRNFVSELNYEIYFSDEHQVFYTNEYGCQILKSELLENNNILTLWEIIDLNNFHLENLKNLGVYMKDVRDNEIDNISTIKEKFILNEQF